MKHEDNRLEHGKYKSARHAAAALVRTPPKGYKNPRSAAIAIALSGRKKNDNQ